MLRSVRNGYKKLNCRLFCTPNSLKLPDLTQPLQTEPFTNKSFIKVDINESGPKPKISTLDNGLRVVSLDWSHIGGAVGLAINTGPRYETADETGAALYCEKMGLKSSENMSQFDIMSHFERTGANITSHQTREQILFEIEALRPDLIGLLDLLTDSVLHPKFDLQEFEEQKYIINYTVSQMLDTPEKWMVEECNRPAYGDGTPMGRSILNIEALQNTQMDTVKNFMKKWYTPSRMVVGGVGIEHERLVENVNQKYGHLPKDNVPLLEENGDITGYYADVPPSEYKGGYLDIVDTRKNRVGIDLPGNFQCFSSVFVGFNGPSLLAGRDYYVAHILATLLGNGSSFSSGGPGKGMYSRVYKNILSSGFVQSGQYIYNPHLDGGVFGLTLSGIQRYTMHTLELACDGLLNLQEFTDEEFERAKNQLMSLVCTNLESTVLTLDDVLRQVSVYNKRYDYDYHVETIKSITKEEALELVKKMLQSPPSVIVYSEDTEKRELSYDDIKEFITEKIIK